MAKDWRKALVKKDFSLREVMATIDKAELQIALVVDDNNKLLGLITDGDIRRAILQGKPLEAKAAEIMTKNPQTAAIDTGRKRLEHILTNQDIHHIPILNSDGVVIDLVTKLWLEQKASYDNQVFLMAGGLGSRLGKLTKNTPKPLLKIGGKPILETIIENFVKQGFNKISLSVNYKKEQIKDYFQDGSDFGAKIDYIDEEKRLGTCGSLSLLSEKPKLPFFVMNADLLTKTDFVSMLEFHNKHQALATMALRKYEIQIPYGVVETEAEEITALKEKPIERYFINAGIYVLEPEAIDYIPKNEYYDMTQLLSQLLEFKQTISSYPIDTYWLDIGRLNELEQANSEYSKLFGV